jgi:hypothetical protein
MFLYKMNLVGYVASLNLDNDANMFRKIRIEIG